MDTFAQMINMYMARTGVSQAEAEKVILSDTGFTPVPMGELLTAKTHREKNAVIAKAVAKSKGEPIENNKRKMKGIPKRRSL